MLNEISMLSSYQAAPSRQGHLDQLYHIFANLKKKPKLTLYFDPRWFEGDSEEIFREQYHDAREQLPDAAMMPQPPLGMPASITAYHADASHAANKVTRRSYTAGFIIFLNRAPIIIYSKR